MEKHQKTIIVDALNNKAGSILSETDQSIYKYYVYALCEKTEDGFLVPFYIGKGQDDRVFDHEDGKDKEIDRIRKEIKDEEEQRIAIEELSEKYKRLYSIGNNLEMVIIKFGMTSQEALMAESALINLLKLDGFVFSQSKHTLTNIQKGHASKGEDAMGSVTLAMTIEEFEKFATPPRDFNEIENSVFISVNGSYPECRRVSSSKEELKNFVREKARAFWRIGTGKKPDYLLAMYQQRVVGVFRIKKQMRKKGKKAVSYYPSILDLNHSDYPRYIAEDNGEYDFLKKLYDVCTKDADGNVIKHPTYDELSDALKSEANRILDKIKGDEPYEKKYKNYLQRKFFVLEDIMDTDTDSQRNSYLGVRICKTTTEDGKTVVRGPIPKRNYIRYSSDL